MILELQGELGWEGEKAGGVVGVLGLDRPVSELHNSFRMLVQAFSEWDAYSSLFPQDKPTLHLGEHHLLHGKITSLPKPFAVIRRVVGTSRTTLGGDAIEGDAEEEEEESSGEGEERTAKKRKVDDDSDEEPPLFAPNPDDLPLTPRGRQPPSSSSPIYPPSAMRDYSSELDMSSPARDIDDSEDDGAEDEEKVAVEAKRKAAKRKRERKEGERERTRHYEVVGVVRKKVVFALR